MISGSLTDSVINDSIVHNETTTLQYFNCAHMQVLRLGCDEAVLMFVVSAVTAGILFPPLNNIVLTPCPLVLMLRQIPHFRSDPSAARHSIPAVATSCLLNLGTFASLKRALRPSPVFLVS